MAWTQADVDKLKHAIATSARSVTYADNTQVVYRDLDEMWQVLGRMQGEVGRANGVKRVRRILLNSVKGVD